MKPLRNAARQVVNVRSIAREPLFAPPGHFYSPIVSRSDAERAREQRAVMALNDGIRLRENAQVEMAHRLGPHWSRFSASWRRYTNNEMFGTSDGAVYYSVLHALRPQRIVEVGSGFSSAIALDVRDETLPRLDLTLIEPYPERLISLLSAADQATLDLHRLAVQDVPIEIFDSLSDGDILFIDSTHVSKSGSDVNWLYFRVLPRLKPGVWVHIHDIFYPFEYVDQWLAERRSWNEAHLLRAFLSFNSVYQIEFFSSWIWQEHPELVTQYLPGCETAHPGSIWLRRVS